MVARYGTVFDVLLSGLFLMLGLAVGSASLTGSLLGEGTNSNHIVRIPLALASPDERSHSGSAAGPSIETERPKPLNSAIKLNLPRLRTFVSGAFVTLQRPALLGFETWPVRLFDGSNDPAFLKLRLGLSSGWGSLQSIVGLQLTMKGDPRTPLEAEAASALSTSLGPFVGLTLAF